PRLQAPDEFSGRGVPQAHGRVGAARGQRLAVRREGDRANVAFVPFQGEAFLARGQVPQLGRAVPAARGERLAIWREHGGEDNVAVPLVSGLLLERGDVPELQLTQEADFRIVTVQFTGGGGQGFAIRGEADAQDRQLVTAERSPETA